MRCSRTDLRLSYERTEDPRVGRGGGDLPLPHCLDRGSTGCDPTT